VKNIILACSLFLFMNIVSAVPTCTTPEPSAIIYFGNGINTDRGSARSSLSRMSKELTNEYNGQKLQYALAYNRTTGMATDLAQASAQSGVQNNRNILRWLNGKNLSPEWLSKWLDEYLSKRNLDVATEVASHANFYLNDILHGKKVIVVSHSQGNFYVNEAKQLLARQLRDGKMSSFAIFGVAVPADNIGGSSGPYLTNHRDFIQKVPRSLPPNWKLHHRDKTVADDLGPIQAHLFNATYLSDDFDIKTALLAGIRSQIDAAVRPAHSCETFNASILSMVAGTYLSTCGIGLTKTIKETRITGTGMVFQDKTSVDLTKMEAILSLSYSPRGTNPGTGFVYNGPLNPPFGAGIWDTNGVFKSPVSVGPTPPWFCSVDDDTPPTKLEKDVNISKTMMAPVQGLYRMLPVNSCTYNRTIKNDKPIEFSVDGSTVRLGDRKWNLSMETQLVTLLGIDPRLPQGEVFKNDEPGFQFHSSDEGNYYSFYYSRNKEILWFSAVEINKSMTFCDFDMRGQDL
jgi:hypothetical protein